MDTKTLALERLGATKLGKKVKFKDYESGLHLNVGEEIIMEIKRHSGEEDFVVGRYDSKSRVYRVAYDPNMKAGRIKEIMFAYAAS